MDVVIGRELDLEDLYTTPDHGNRYEILDAALIMTPAPNIGHQRVVSRLLIILNSAIRGLDLEVLHAPIAWRIGPGQVPEPDLVVTVPESPAARAIAHPPLLVVEVLSPQGRGRDLFEKRRIYAEGGAASSRPAPPDGSVQSAGYLPPARFEAQTALRVTTSRSKML